MRTPALGLERIDHDHQALFRELTDLRAAVRAGIRSQVEGTLAFIRTYVETHFAEEEREMLATGYPHYHVHRAAHGRLGREVRALEEEWAKQGLTPVLAESVVEALSEWFEVHILELDAQLVRHLKATSRPRTQSVGWPTGLVRLQPAHR